MKDQKGHGSNSRGGRLAKPIPGHHFHSKSAAELRYIAKDAAEAGRNAAGMGDHKGVSKYADQVADAASVMGYRDRGGKQDAPNHGLIEGMQAKLKSDVDAGRMLHSGTSKSAPAPAHDAMTQKRLSDAHGSMSRLKETFHAGNGNNRGGEYGRNVKDAYDRHAAVVHGITGKRPNIYDR